MKLELFGRPLRKGRLLLYLPVACTAVVAGVLLLPSGLVGLALLSILALPLLLLFFDSPRLILYVLLIIIFSNIDIFAPFRIYRAILAFFVVSFAVAVLSGRGIVIHHQIFLALTAAFLIIAFQSISVARDLDSSLMRLNTFLKILLIIALTFQFVRNRQEFKHFLLVIALGILASNFLPFVLHPPTRFASLSLIWSQGVFRYEGLVFEPNTFALFQVFLIPILLFLAVCYRRPPIVRPVFLLAALASVFVMILSFSRGGFVSLSFLFFLLLVVERRNRTVQLVGVAVILLVIVTAPAIYWDRIRSIFDFSSRTSKDHAIVTRLEMMKVAFKIGITHPFLGVGLENFLIRSASFLPYKMVVHNTFLQVLAELGVFALAAMLGIVCYNLRIIAGLVRRRRDPEAAQLGRALLIQHIAVFLNAMLIPMAYDTVLWFMLAIPSMAEYAYRDRPRG